MPEGDAELQDLYRDVLLDYYRSRTHKGKAEPADVRGHGVSPICGDDIEVTASREGDKLARIRYEGHGCVISQASTAMMAEALEGRTAVEALRLAAAFGDFMVRRGPPEALPEELEETKALEGVRKFPARVKCAMLSWNTLRLALEQGAAEFRETEDHGPAADKGDDADARRAFPSFKDIGKALAQVEDPEMHVSIVELGLVYGARIEDGGGAGGKRVVVTMSLTTPACPYGPMLLATAQAAVARVPGVDAVEVELAFDPPWDPRTFASDEAKDTLGIF